MVLSTSKKAAAFLGWSFAAGDLFDGTEFSKENSDVVQIELTELNILEDEALKNQYSEEIPVLQINGATHAYWKIDSERLLAALNELV